MFWDIVNTVLYYCCIITVYHLSYRNFKYYKYRIKLATYDRKEWVMCLNYVSAILHLLILLPTLILFTLILIKNGIFNPVDIADFSKITGTSLGIDIERFRHTASNVIHPITYFLFICGTNLVFHLKDVYNRITMRNLRVQYWNFCILTVIAQLVLGI